MATFNISLPGCLLCSCEQAGNGNVILLYLDEVKYPGVVTNPVPATINSAAQASVYCAEENNVLPGYTYSVTVDDSDMPVSGGSPLLDLDLCDLVSWECEDCCTELDVRVTALEGVTPISAADAISPAADDAVGAVGTGIGEYVREDHKHPAQGISADAGQLLTVGTDGLHLLDPSALPNYPLIFAGVAEMRAFDSSSYSDGQMAVLLNYYSTREVDVPDDGGSLMRLRKTPAVGLADDGGMVFAGTGTDRWIRVTDRSGDVELYGARPVRTGGAWTSYLDSATEVQSCVDNNARVQFGEGEYSFGEVIEVPAARVIAGTGRQSTVLRFLDGATPTGFGGGSSAIAIFSSAAYDVSNAIDAVTYRDFSIDGNGANLAQTYRVLAIAHYGQETQVINVEAYGYRAGESATEEAFVFFMAETSTVDPNKAAPSIRDCYAHSPANCSVDRELTIFTAVAQDHSGSERSSAGPTVTNCVVANHEKTAGVNIQRTKAITISGSGGRITNNTCHDVHGSAVNLNAFAPMHDCVISGNAFHNVLAGINILINSPSIVYEGISITDNVIALGANSAVISPADYFSGISLGETGGSGNGTCDDVYIADNIIKLSEVYISASNQTYLNGIFLRQNSDIRINDIVIKDNVIDFGVALDAGTFPGGAAIGPNSGEIVTELNFNYGNLSTYHVSFGDNVRFDGTACKSTHWYNSQTFARRTTPTGSASFRDAVVDRQTWFREEFFAGDIPFSLGWEKLNGANLNLVAGAVTPNTPGVLQLGVIAVGEGAIFLPGSIQIDPSGAYSYRMSWRFWCEPDDDLKLTMGLMDQNISGWTNGVATTYDNRFVFTAVRVGGVETVSSTHNSLGGDTGALFQINTFIDRDGTVLAYDAETGYVTRDVGVTVPTGVGLHPVILIEKQGAGTAQCYIDAFQLDLIRE